MVRKAISRDGVEGGVQGPKHRLGRGAKGNKKKKSRFGMGTSCILVENMRIHF